MIAPCEEKMTGSALETIKAAAALSAMVVIISAGFSVGIAVVSVGHAVGDRIYAAWRSAPQSEK